MHDQVTIVISAAGMGSRLGMDVPKALIEVGGTPILARQLAALSDVDDVIVVVGYRGELVVDLLRELRSDARVLQNPDYATTGTAASVALAAEQTTGWLLALDGDVLVRTDDLEALRDQPGACLGLTTTRTAQPVFAHLDAGDDVVELSQDDPSPWEWSGAAKLHVLTARELGTGHVFTGLAPFLPIASLPIDCVEIDDLDDLRYAETWVTA